MYKFNSLWLELSSSKNTIERSTYDMLQWLGDVGGLYDGLILIIRFFISPLIAVCVKAEMHAEVFKYEKQETEKSLVELKTK